MGETTGDRRYDFLGDYVLKTLKLKNDKWQRCVGVEDNKVVIQDFFDKAEHVLLVISANQAGILTPTYEFPVSGKTKCVYLIKRARESISPDSINSQLLLGDLSYAPLEQMSSVVDDVSTVVFKL